MKEEDYKNMDLDDIEELNYEATREEDVIIDEHVRKLQALGYGSIVNLRQIEQLFWDLTLKNIVCTKLFRVAVVECIDVEGIYERLMSLGKLMQKLFLKRPELKNTLLGRVFDDQFYIDESAGELHVRDKKTSKPTCVQNPNDPEAVF